MRTTRARTIGGILCWSGRHGRGEGFGERGRRTRKHKFDVDMRRNKIVESCSFVSNYDGRAAGHSAASTGVAAQPSAKQSRILIWQCVIPKIRSSEDHVICRVNSCSLI